METAASFMEGIDPAARSLFKALNEYGWQKMRAFVGFVNAKSSEELSKQRADFRGIDVAREAISGSILQLAYFGIEKAKLPATKPAGALRFEREMDRMVRERPNARIKPGEFKVPIEFCVGREIGDLPIGLIVYAGRNQFNHYNSDRLSVVNEVVFNYLEASFPNPGNGRSFNLRDGKKFYSWSVLCALGWVDGSSGMGYDAFKRDMNEILALAP